MTGLDWSKQEAHRRARRLETIEQANGGTVRRANYPASRKQLAYIAVLAKKVGVRSLPVRTRSEATAEIARLKKHLLQ